MAAQQQFKVQRGKATFGASADTLDVTVTTVGALSKAFVRITNVAFASHGAAAGSNTARTNRDVGVTVKFTDTSTIQFERSASATDFDVAVWWELVEYVGPAGGPHEFIVRNAQGTLTIASGSATADGANFTPSNSYTKCVPIVQGVRCANAGSTWSNMALDPTIIDNGDGTAKARFTRVGTGFAEPITFCVVEFTGSFWTVQTASFTFSATGTTSFSCSAVVWAKTMMFAYCTTGGDNSRDLFACFWEGADTTHFRGNIPASSTTTSRAGHVYLVTHPKLAVRRDDSITGSIATYSTSASLPQNEARAIPFGTPISDTAQTMMIGFSTNDSSTATYPAPHWSYALKSTTQVEFERARGNAGAGNFAFQVIDLSSITIDQESASTSATGTPAADPRPRATKGVSATGTPTAHTVARATKSVSATGTPTAHVVARASKSMSATGTATSTVRPRTPASCAGVGAPSGHARPRTTSSASATGTPSARVIARVTAIAAGLASPTARALARATAVCAATGTLAFACAVRAATSLSATGTPTAPLVMVTKAGGGGGGTSTLVVACASVTATVSASASARALAAATVVAQGDPSAAVAVEAGSSVAQAAATATPTASYRIIRRGESGADDEARRKEAAQKKAPPPPAPKIIVPIINPNVDPDDDGRVMGIVVKS